MAWPVSQDYNEAIQDPQSTFHDPELRAGEATTNALGMPMPRSGNFADVYEFLCPDTKSKWAIKCFTRHVTGLRERYLEIGKALADAKLPFTVDFQYLVQGMRVRGEWFPILKMRWVEGLLLNEFVRDNLDKPALLNQLGFIWGRMAKRLREAEIAHADLQHGNVLLVAGSKSSSLAVKLIDYDGMFVPALAKTKSGEVGHPNYQHPQRLREGIYNGDVDRFPLLVVATALRALSVGGRELWDRHDNGDNFLFRETDLQAPQKSALFKELKEITEPQTKSLVMELEKAIGRKLEEAPAIDELLPEAKALSTRSSPEIQVAPKAPQPIVAPVVAAPPVDGEWPTGITRPTASTKKRRLPVMVLAMLGGLCAVLLGGMLAGGVGWMMLSGKKKDPVVLVKPPENDTTVRNKPTVSDPGGVKPKPTMVKPVTDSFVPLFNGKDLTGWKPHVRFPGDWRVIDGILTGSGTNTGYLITTRNDFKDFHLRVDVRYDNGAGNFNANILSRCLDDLRGYDISIRNAPGKTGDIVVRSSTKSPIDKFGTGPGVAVRTGTWFTLEILAVGNRTTVLVDRKLVSEYIDANMEFLDYSSGRIALRHDLNSTIEFRKIEIKELPPDVTPPVVAEAAPPELIPERPVTIVTMPEKVMTGHQGRLMALAFSPDGQSVISSSNSNSFTPVPGKKGVMYQRGDDNTVRVWNLATGDQFFSFNRGLGQENQHGPIYGFALSPDKKSIAIASCQAFANPALAAVTVWNLAKGARTHHFPLTNNSNVWTPWFTPDGQSLLAFREDRTVHVLSLADEKETKQFKLEGDGKLNLMFRFCMTKDRKHAVGAGLNGKIYMWSMENGKNVKEFAAHTKAVTAVALSPDEKFLVSTSLDGTARIWNFQDGREEKTLDHGVSIPLCALFVGGSSKVVTGTRTNAAILWDTETGKQLCRFEGHSDLVSCLAVSADGQHFATGSYDKTARVWKVPTLNGAAPIVSASDGFVSLFNGSDLSGWQNVANEPGAWSVQNGILLGTGSRTSVLFTTKNGFKDFHLRVDARFKGSGPVGGIWPQFSTDYSGFEAAIHEPSKVTGNLFVTSADSKARVGTGTASVISEDQWFTLDVLVEKNRLSVKVNGKITAEYEEKEKKLGIGHVALTRYGNAKIEFRKVEIKEIKAGSPPPDPVRSDLDPIKEKLGSLRIEYEKEFQQRKKRVKDVLEQAEQTARKDGNQKLANQAKYEREVYEKTGLLPTTINTSKYVQETLFARTKLITGHGTAISEYTKAKQTEQAALVETELSAFLRDFIAANPSFGPVVGTRWAHSKGLFEVDERGIWIEKQNGNIVFTFDASRTPAFVLLSDRSRACLVYLYNDRCLVQFGATPAKEFYKGSWIR